LTDVIKLVHSIIGRVPRIGIDFDALLLLAVEVLAIEELALEDHLLLLAVEELNQPNFLELRLLLKFILIPRIALACSLLHLLLESTSKL
jgi:hypothetical protein